VKRILHAVATIFLLAGCGDKGGTKITNVYPPAAPPPSVNTAALKQRAYIVSALSSDMTVIDLSDPANATVMATLPVASRPHMAETSKDATKVYSSGTLANQVSIYDAATLTLIKHLPVGVEPTHMTASLDNSTIAVNCEGSNAIYFINVATDDVTHIVPGMLTPHWVAFRPDMRFAYVANIGGYRISIIDLASFTVVGHVFMSGHSDPNETTVLAEGGFAECFIDSMGMLYSAHNETGKVLVVNTTTNAKVKEIDVNDPARPGVSSLPWVAYVSPFGGEKIMVATQGTQDTVIIDGNSQTVSARVRTDGYNVLDYYTGTTVRVSTPESEVFGVNFAYSNQKAYAGMRTNGAIQRIDLLTNTATAVYSLTEGLPVPGFTQPAATTPNQRYLIFTVTSKSDWGEPGAAGPVNRIVIFDSQIDQAVRVFDNVGSFPWSVTIPDGHNYCH
jgi:hypothetical protein